MIRMKREIEVKIQLNKAEFEKLLPEKSNFTKEATFGFFKPNMSNIAEGVFPRIKFIDRKEKPIVLTVKRKQNQNIKYFEREETEVTFNEKNQLNDLRAIIKNLGYSKEIIFEKRRYEKKYHSLALAYDILPFGYYLELEGEPEDIEKYLSEKKLLGKPRIIESYLYLWEKHRKEHSILEEDCLFKKN